MGFSWPYVLLGLVAVPVLALAYRWQLRRRRRVAVPYSSLALLKAAAPRRPTWKRHLPVGLLLAALAVLTVAAARPQARVDVPTSGAAVIIALDVSGSMCATDVDPNRLSAAQDAVRGFVQDQDDSTRLGLVVFSGSAQVAVAPTTQHEQLLTAIDALTTGRGTTIGSAILKSIDAIAQINPDVAPVGTGDVLDEGAGGPRADGSFAPEIVVLLTDGANTTGTTPLEAAAVAAGRGVRVYPIGFGTTNPTSLVCSAAQLGGSGFDQFGRRGGTGGGIPGARRSFLIADEPTLRQVATTTGGEYFSAQDADQLAGVLEDLPRQVVVQQRDVELSAGLAALAALLVLGALGAAVRWSAFP